jgi:hypothetical protein
MRRQALRAGNASAVRCNREYDPRGLLRNDRALTGTGLSVEPPRQLHVAVDRLARFRDSKATRDILSSLLKNLSVFNTTVCSRWGPDMRL